MREKPRVSSFEPRRLRAVRKELEALERRLTRTARTSREGGPKAPGLLLRWWRMLFGAE